MAARGPGRLGYSVTPEALRRSIDFYLAGVTHGSTLCKVVHASVLARVEPSRSWEVFGEALRADLDDTQGGTTREGIHLGAMAGTVDMVARDFAGVQVHGNRLVFDPCLPDQLSRVGFEVGYRGQRIDVVLDHDLLRLSAHPCASAAPVDVLVAGVAASLAPGAALQFQMRPSVLLPALGDSGRSAPG